MEIDPVCKMNLEPAKAAAKVDYAGQTYYFCSGACHHKFTVAPSQYAEKPSHGGAGDDHA